jgi:hypothetical protein
MEDSFLVSPDGENWKEVKVMPGSAFGFHNYQEITLKRKVDIKLREDEDAIVAEAVGLVSELDKILVEAIISAKVKAAIDGDDFAEAKITIFVKLLIDQPAGN